MEATSIYRDIALRTQGDIYIGVVGPVRTGKSTLIRKFMETMVIPNIESGFRRERAVDELPQAAAGRTIMTTEPKFIPEEAVRVTLEGKANFRARMIDCVGYIVPSALGYIEDEIPRMVQTPWFEEEIPFNMAAEIGTRKVITEHSTVGLLVTTDGSIGEIPRVEYEEAEERVVEELKAINKPFVMVLNCVEPHRLETQELAGRLSEKYDVPVVAMDCLTIDSGDVERVLAQLLLEFPVREIRVDLPRWIVTLPTGHWLKTSVYDAVRTAAGDVSQMSGVDSMTGRVLSCDAVDNCQVTTLDLGSGAAGIQIWIRQELFFKIMSEETGLPIAGEAELMPWMIELAAIKREYDKIRGALDQVAATGYGIVMPAMDELSLEEPEIVKQGGKYGVRLRASAPSIHLMRADITAEVSPIVGSEKQSEELVHYLLQEFEEHPSRIWESNIFGKSLHELVNEGLHNKLARMPGDARLRLQETVERIINEGCNGLICIIL